MEIIIPALHHPLVHAAAGVSIRIASPTRDLAQQIVDEAVIRITYFPKFQIHIVYAGTGTAKDVSGFPVAIPQFLVALQARLVDHFGIEEYGFQQGVSSLDVLILDKDDWCLDMVSA